MFVCIVGNNPLCSAVQLCLTLCNPMDCSLPGSSAHGIFQARILELGAISYSRRSSQLTDRTRVFWVTCIGRWLLYHLGNPRKICQSLGFQSTDTWIISRSALVCCFLRQVKQPGPLRNVLNDPSKAKDEIMLNVQLYTWHSRGYRST